MRTRLVSGRWRSLLLAAGLVPFALALQYAMPTGIPVAEGCSGASGQPPPPTVVLPSEQGTFGVATDGFVPIVVAGPNVTATNSSLSVLVTTAADEPVPGEVKVLQTPAIFRATVGWKASQPLSVGAKLKLKASFDGPSGPVAEAQLEVTGAPTPLPNFGLALGTWYDIAHGVGEPVSCAGTIGVGGCDGGARPATLTIPSGEQILHSLSSTWTYPPQPHGYVAWEARVELPDGQASVWAEPQPQVFIGRTDGAFPPLDMGRLVFPLGTQRYCVVLAVRDLWSGAEQKSEVCGEPAAIGEPSRDYPIERCNQPPNDALTWAWCQPENHWFDPSCSQFLNGGGGGPPMMPGAGGGNVHAGTGGSPTSAAGAGSPTSGGSLPNGSQPPLQPQPPNTSQSTFGCHLADGTTGTRPLSVLFLAGAAIARWRRSRRPGKNQAPG